VQKKILWTALSMPVTAACRTHVGPIGGPDPGGNEMAQYLILIYEDETQYATASPEVYGEIMQEHRDWPARAEQHGVKILGGEALQSTGTATSIRGGSDVTDGPFVETKEVLGGYYLIEAPDLDAALAVGKLCPARFGGVEVRPIMTFE
jgi:hypothetical protein